jgi:beta-lactamase regulating signal transducer with metallopeptidase domain
MILNWMIRISFATLLIALAAWSAERALRHGKRASRWVWVAAVVSVVGFVIVSRFWPGLLQPEDASRLHALVETAQRADGSITGAESSVTSLSRYAGAFWITTSAIAILVYVAGWYRLNRLKRQCRPGVLSGARVLVSERAGPAAVGLFHPVIVVPSWLLTANERARRLVLLHEAEHLRAGDHLLLGLAPLAAIAMPWNLPLWWMVQALRLSIEVDCDLRVLSRGVSADAYGRVLIDVAGHRRPAFALALAAPRSRLAHRLIRLTAEVSRARVLPWAMAAACMVLFAGASAPASPWTKQVQRADPLLSELDPSAQYEIDGVRATFEQAAALHAGDVRSIEVIARRTVSSLSSDSATDRTVRIRTRAFPAPLTPLQPIRLEGEAGKDQTIRIRDSVALPVREVRLLLDGREIDGRQLESVDPTQIHRVQVIRRSGAMTEVQLTTRQRA